MAAAGHLFHERHARAASPNDQRADAFRAVELVCREREHVGVGEVHRDLARRLRGVDQKQNAPAAAGLGKRCEVVEDARLVVGGHRGGHDGVRAERVGEAVGVERPVGADGHDRHGGSVAFEGGGGVEHGAVFGGGCDEVSSFRGVGLQRAAQREVERLGGTAGEDDL